MVRRFNIAILLIIAGLVTLNVIQYQEKKDARTAVAAAMAQAEYWKDEAGRSNAKVLVLQTDYATLKQSNIHLKDSLAALGIKLKDAKRVVTITKKIVDTVEVNAPRFRGPWVEWEWIDTNRLTFLVKDSLSLVTHEDRYGLFNLKSKYVTRATSYNPHTVLTGITSVEIVPKRRPALGFYGGYGLTVSGGAVRVGPQAGFGLMIGI